VPTVFKEGPYRFFFVPFDCNEPPHIHVQRDRKEAKVWLNPIEVERDGGFAKHRLTEINELIEANYSRIMDEWARICGQLSD
jgi:hypothetical protein